MAGAGTKLFVAGDVLTAAEVNTYLMDQSVMRFADATARTNAFGGVGEPTLAEGMLSYLDSDNTVYVYDGSAWKAVGVASTIDAKGDLLVGTANDTVGRQAVGANGSVLMADSAQTNGIAWSEQSLGYRNVVINGAMQVAQRATSVAGITASGYWTADRWNLDIGSLGTWTQSVENDAPTGSGLRKSLKMTCTTADASPAAGDFMLLQTLLEGQNVQQFLKGTASAKGFTLTFWVKGTTTGTYVASLYDNDNARNVGKTYTIDTANTWEKKTLAFPADTTGAFDNDNAQSLRIWFGLGFGTNFTSGTLPATWASYSAANSFAGQTVNLAGATSRSWQITGVQLEAGSVATPFEFEDIQTTFIRCYRYFQTSYIYGSTWPSYPTGGVQVRYNNSVDTGYIDGFSFIAPMRAAPTITLYNQVSGLVGIYRGSDAANVTGNTFPRIGTITSGLITLGTANQNSYWFHWVASAEL